MASWGTTSPVTKLVPAQRLRILDFDIENRPLSYLGQDFTTSDITAIAASFEGERLVHAWILGEDDITTTEEMLLGFTDLYAEADIVTGHYIRMHDLPIINGALMELGLASLGKKLTSDTKLDLKTRKGISASQESLSDMREVKAPKYQMTQKRWRSANRLTPEGIAQTRKRVVADIRQHKQLRQSLIAGDYLNPPTLWTP